MRFQNRHGIGLGLVLLVILTMLAATAPAAPLPSFDLVGDKNSCAANGLQNRLTTGNDGCVKFIAGAYTDALGNDFTIQDLSSSNKARIEFVEGAVSKLILAGATIVASEQITNATITFRHLFTGASSTYATGDSLGNDARNNFSGAFNLLYPNQSTRTDTARAFAELCQVDNSSDTSPACLTTNGNAFTDPALQGTIPSAVTFRSFAPSPDVQGYLDPGFTTKPLLRGVITISSLRSTERTSNLTHSILMANSGGLPPFDDSSCGTDEDIGKIVRGGTAEFDTICVKTSDGDFRLLPGPEALTLVSAPECTVIPGETHRPPDAGP